MRPFTLYDASAALQQVEAWIDEHSDEVLANGGALTPQLGQLLDQAEGDFKARIEACAAKVRELSALGDAAKQEAARLTQLARVRENAAVSLKEWMKRNMLAAGEPKVETPRFKVRVQNNPPALRHGYSETWLLELAADPGLVPFVAPFVTTRTIPSLDSRGLLAAVKARREELVALAEQEIPALTIEEELSVQQALDDIAEHGDVPEPLEEACAAVLAEKRADFVATRLDLEFPGCTIEQGSHLRIA